jgi:predicted O-methyltransferase YrrM
VKINSKISALISFVSDPASSIRYHAFRRPLFRDYFRIRRDREIARLVGRPPAEVRALWRCYTPIREKLLPTVENPDFGRSEEELYVLIRVIRPRIVVETGVAAGVSSWIILESLTEQGFGSLYSIDIGDESWPSLRGRGIGWIVPDSLRSRWKLIIGDGPQELSKLLPSLGPIDLFFHDSDHSYTNTKNELSVVWPYLREGGVALVDDVNFSNPAFDEFCRLKKPARSGKWTRSSLGVMGAFVK